MAPLTHPQFAKMGNPQSYSKQISIKHSTDTRRYYEDVAKLKRGLCSRVVDKPEILYKMTTPPYLLRLALFLT